MGGKQMGPEHLDEEPDDELDEDEEWDDEEELDDLLERVHEWGMAWSQSERYAKLTEEQQAESEFVVGSFAEYMYTYHDVVPEEWDASSLQACCLDTLPRKISAGEEYYRSIAPVLASFFRFLE